MSPDAAYWRAYRARNRERLNAQARARRALGRVRNRANEYASRPSRAVPKLLHLFDDIRRGRVVSFWEDELAMDLRQEMALAELEGRDPIVAAQIYRLREQSWHWFTVGSLDDPMLNNIGNAIGNVLADAVSDVLRNESEE